MQGAKVTLETMDGPVSLTVPPGSSGGKILRLKGKGWQREKGGRGDLYARLDIVLPNPIDPELAQFIDTWAKSQPYTVKR